MSDIKLWGWDKKVRTMLRFIKAGDIFCFKLDEKRYCFGRIMAKCMVGHFAEIFDYISNDTVIEMDDIKNVSRLTSIVILDSYSLFDRKTEGEWRIIGRQEDYMPTDAEDVYFAWAIGSGCRKSNIFDDTIFISEEESRSLPKLSSNGDWVIRRQVFECLNEPMQ